MGIGSINDTMLTYGENIVDNGEYGKDNIVYYTHNMANL